jgi:hypothetical protein
MNEEPEPGEPNRARTDGFAALAAVLLAAVLITMVIKHFV